MSGNGRFLNPEKRPFLLAVVDHVQREARWGAGNPIMRCAGGRFVCICLVLTLVQLGVNRVIVLMTALTQLLKCSERKPLYKTWRYGNALHTFL